MQRFDLIWIYVSIGPKQKPAAKKLKTLLYDGSELFEY